MSLEVEQVYEVFENMLEDLLNHKRDRKKILKESVENRLNDSLMVYYSELKHSLEYLGSKNSVRVMKESNKM